MSAKETFADPGHWAVTAFSATSMMLGFINAHLINPTAMGIIIPTAFIFGGLVQLIVAVIEIMRGSTFGAVAFGSYGPFWIIVGLYLQFYAKTVSPASAGTTLALFLWMFGIISLYLFIASLKTDVVLATILALLVLTFVLLALGSAYGSASLTEAGGWTTIIFAILGFYHAASGTITSTWGKVLLPLGPLTKKS
ncbi:MAG: acetate uptake transporter [Actinomycetota bacterium]|nr:acetate uptake transporter [Actinomycetota bacterium]